MSPDAEGMQRLFNQFSFPNDNHVAPDGRVMEI
ncbi:MAG TPA: hypothetical protein PK529_05905 [Verrucomicrobiales bacterium]|nr:hypothetical protein [Verrucomicrobiales bacterium]